MSYRVSTSFVVLCVALPTYAVGGPIAAQTLTEEDPVLRQIWDEGMHNSHLEGFAQALMDSVGPRLTGSPGHEAGNQWLIDTYAGLGIDARSESYGTWMRWRRGRTHVDLVEPRVRSLDATSLAWTPGTEGRTVQGGVSLLPQVLGPEDLDPWIESVEGKFVVFSFPEPTCRPDPFLRAYASNESYRTVVEDREQAKQAFDANIQRMGFDPANRRSMWPLARRLEQAGALGILTSSWPQGWGVHTVFNGGTEQVPTLALSCEDYGLVHRLAERGQDPIVEVTSDNEFLGEGPVYQVIGEIPGGELANEYVLLSAHFDSWDAGSGATDNGTGTIVMMEAMRILRSALPDPKRTILVGHWAGEEQGLNGSRAFAEDHPEVVDGLQAMFNQDNGTFRIVSLDASGFTGATGTLARWLAKVPLEISQNITSRGTGEPADGGSDHAAMLCHGAPGFRIGSPYADYREYTWHTNRDTYDKVVLPEVQNNATLTAMLAYLASEDPERVPRDQRTLFGPETSAWPECEAPRRSYDQRRR